MRYESERRRNFKKLIAKYFYLRSRVSKFHRFFRALEKYIDMTKQRIIYKICVTIEN